MRYGQYLPQLAGDLFMTDGGIETTLIFQDGLDLPQFAAFHLLATAEGTDALRRYFTRYALLARRYRCGLVLESPTWRANPDWAARIGYGPKELTRAIRQAIGLMVEVRTRWERPQAPFVISGNVGPRGDGYVADRRMPVDESRAYHGTQLDVLAATDVDMVAAFTITYADEGIGIALAAQERALPSAISFTVDTDGRLPSGEPLADAIARTDDETGGAPAYYMINCAHPSHFAAVLQGPGDWHRLRGLRTNASALSHAELDGAAALDTGDPVSLAQEHVALRALLPGLAVVGGCCGTDERHVDAIFSHLGGRAMAIGA